MGVGDIVIINGIVKCNVCKVGCVDVMNGGKIGY